MEANPHVMRALESMARAYLRRGEKFGVKRLVEQIRWDMRGIENAGMFKVNNNFTAYIARELLRRMPRLKGLIELCVVQGEREDVA
jgi:hypothetical protein